MDVAKEAKILRFRNFKILALIVSFHGQIIEKRDDTCKVHQKSLESHLKCRPFRSLTYCLMQGLNKHLLSSYYQTLCKVSVWKEAGFLPSSNLLSSGRDRQVK